VYPENESLDWLPAEKIDFYDLMYAGLIYTLNTQIMLLKKAHVSSGVRKDKRIAMKFQTTQCIKANELLIAQLKEELSLDDHP
jgi:hypothetical protein